MSHTQAIHGVLLIASVACVGCRGGDPALATPPHVYHEFADMNEPVQWHGYQLRTHYPCGDTWHMEGGRWVLDPPEAQPQCGGNRQAEW